jgi:hypothetical protein
MLTACSTCGRHHRAEATCPHCGALRAVTRTAAAVLLGLVAAGCDGVGNEDMVALYGAEVTFTDDDGDGWALEEGDCDDTDAAVHPEATETAGDLVDSNCDGEDDT